MKNKGEKTDSWFDLINSVHSQRVMMRVAEKLTGRSTRRHEGFFGLLSKIILAGGALRTLMRIFRSKR